MMLQHARRNDPPAAGKLGKAAAVRTAWNPIFILLIAAALPHPAPAQPTNPPARPGSVFHIRITGDIECMAPVREFRGLLRDAQRDRAALVIIEIGGNESRLDLICEMARGLREMQLPTIVFLNDADHTVGPGALCLGQVARECIIAPDMTVCGRVGGIAQNALAPDDTRWSTLSDELTTWCQAGCTIRRIPDALPTAMVAGARPAWAVFDRSAYTIAYDEPEAADTVPIVAQHDGTYLTTLTAAQVVRLRLATTTLDSWTTVLNRADLRSAPRIERTISASIGARALRAESLLTASEKSLEHATLALKMPWPRAKDVSPTRYQEAADKGRNDLDTADAALRDLEQLLEQQPELLRRPAPGQTTVAGKPSVYTSRWRTAVQSRRDKAAKLRAVADKFAACID